MTETTETRPKDPVKSLIGVVLDRRDSRTSTGYIAAVRQGLTPETELTAIPYTDSIVGALPVRRRTGARRAAALCASNQKISQSKDPYRRLGQALRDLHFKDTGAAPCSDKPNSITQLVGALPMLDLESAVQIIGGLLRRAGNHHVNVNFYELASTLSNWGNGVDAASEKVRNQIVIDFYTNTNR